MIDTIASSYGWSLEDIINLPIGFLSDLVDRIRYRDAWRDKVTLLTAFDPKISKHIKIPRIPYEEDLKDKSAKIGNNISREDTRKAMDEFSKFAFRVAKEDGK